ncbi:ragulator complex protein LAMTOR4-like [Eurytemora carolleeae]|uniref:ragulator complex protein LAMTOR4-like n=1 Tax=Eurytemora carolleeae TaxID=1294199 RepID=UPI000C76CA5D|nr:ragulator complex protein LAMTOR4-like [Eurytemora carolleeae]|eukprot:XP_023345959.1 ragulator complex protein LAMTOR4-like [Eurytemora affinis]
MNFDQISGQTGYLILNQDGAILSSGGDLENDERTAGNIFKLIAAATSGGLGNEVEKISVNYAEHSYVVSTANKKIHIVKKNVSDL